MFVLMMQKNLQSETVIPSESERISLNNLRLIVQPFYESVAIVERKAVQNLWLPVLQRFYPLNKLRKPSLIHFLIKGL